MTRWGGLTQSHKEGAWGRGARAASGLPSSAVNGPASVTFRDTPSKYADAGKRLPVTVGDVLVRSVSTSRRTQVKKSRVARLAFHACMHELTSDLEGDIKSYVTITDPRWNKINK